MNIHLKYVICEQLSMIQEEKSRQATRNRRPRLWSAEIIKILNTVLRSFMRTFQQLVETELNVEPGRGITVKIRYSNRGVYLEGNSIERTFFL